MVGLAVRSALSLLLILASLGAPNTHAEPVLRARANPVTRGVGPFRRVVRSIAKFQGDLWVGTWGDGLLRRSHDGSWRRYRAATSWLTEDRVNCLETYKNELWIGTCGGLDVLNSAGIARAIPTGSGSVAHDVYHVVRAVPKGQLWVGTTGEGLSVLQEGTWSTYRASSGLLDTWINDVLVDRGDVTWVGTGSGLYSGSIGAWREHRAQGSPPPIDTEITALARQGKTLWVGTMDEGLWGLRDGYWLQVGEEFLPPSRQILALVVDQAGALWVGTGWGLAQYRFDRGFERIGEARGLPREEIKVIHEDPVGTLRVGTTSGRVYERIGKAGAETVRFQRIFDPRDSVEEVLEVPNRSR